MGHFVHCDFLVVTPYGHLGDYRRFQGRNRHEDGIRRFLPNGQKSDEHNLNFHLHENVEY
jgi:hypothetical protein